MKTEDLGDPNIWYPKITLPDYGQAIADSVSQVVANAHVGRAVDEALQAASRSFDKLAAVYQPSIDIALRAMTDAINPAALASVQLAASDYLRRANEFARAAEDLQRYEIALAKAGWWFPGDLSNTEFVQVGRVAVAGRRRDTDAAMVELVSGENLTWLISRWWDSAAFRRRKLIISDGLQDHRSRRFRVSIPTLLPTIEGIAFDEFAPGSSDTATRQVVAVATQQYDPSLGSAIADAIDYLWSRVEWAGLPARTRLLNRHLILHGRSTGYGTAANSTRVVLTLEHLFSLVREKERKARGTGGPG